MYNKTFIHRDWHWYNIADVVLSLTYCQHATATFGMFTISIDILFLLTGAAKPPRQICDAVKEPPNRRPKECVLLYTYPQVGCPLGGPRQMFSHVKRGRNIREQAIPKNTFHLCVCCVGDDHNRRAFLPFKSISFRIEWILLYGSL